MHGTAPLVSMRQHRFAGETRILLEEWKSPCNTDGGKDPKWAGAEEAVYEASLLPGVDHLYVSLWDENKHMSDSFICDTWICLHDVLVNGKDDRWHPLYIQKGEQKGEIHLEMSWHPSKSSIPAHVICPLTMSIPTARDAAGKLLSMGFTLHDKTIGELKKKFKSSSDQQLVQAVRACYPSIMEAFTAKSVKILEQGGVPVCHVDGEASRAGLRVDDIIIGYASDSKIKDPEKTGINGENSPPPPPPPFLSRSS